MFCFGMVWRSFDCHWIRSFYGWPIHVNQEIQKNLEQGAAPDGNSAAIHPRR
jgi:hypothetical protein